MRRGRRLKASWCAGRSRRLRASPRSTDDGAFVAETPGTYTVTGHAGWTERRSGGSGRPSARCAAVSRSQGRVPLEFRGAEVVGASEWDSASTCLRSRTGSMPSM